MVSACMLSHFSHVRLFGTLWTVARQDPLSTGFSRQEYWSGLPCSPPGVKVRCEAAIQVYFFPQMDNWLSHTIYTMVWVFLFLLLSHVQDLCMYLVLTSSSDTVLNRINDSEYLCLIPDFKGNALIMVPSKIMSVNQIFFNGQKTWTNISPKKIYEWQISTWKNFTNHQENTNKCKIFLYTHYFCAQSLSHIWLFASLWITAHHSHTCFLKR